MRVGRRCFVSNLAWRTSWQDLKDKFRDCGNVVYANVIRDEGGESDPQRRLLRGCLVSLLSSRSDRN